ncbi:chordin-like [Tetranychus urticae]|uniref:VWFC domain-containing protein n=1 Tax=Tetranychus urticae TaxID=32264 RepID=T1K3I2_TETUR|nr:chordin-like [Tetranychus urticae]XP_015782257.1 chordin-like [Tetranychus urticae]
MSVSLNLTMVSVIIVLLTLTYCTSMVNSFPETAKLSTIKKASSKYGTSRSGFDSCYSKGVMYSHGSNLTRSDDPCEKCFCYKGSILCWNINCPQSLGRQGCKEIKIKDLCCPILECPLAAKDAAVKDLTGRQPRLTSDSSLSLPSLGLSSITKEVTCKYGQEIYRPGQRITINPLKPCQRCVCGLEGKVKCELLSTCKEERDKESQASSPKHEADSEESTENQVSSFSTRTIPDAVLKRVQNLLHKVSTHNLTSINPNDLN